MSKRRPIALDKAKRYSDFLLYQATGGTMGAAPVAMLEGKDAEGLTFGEKRSLLDSLIKIATLESKQEDEGVESGFDMIKRGLNANAKSNHARNLGGGKNTSIESFLATDELDADEAEH